MTEEELRKRERRKRKNQKAAQKKKNKWFEARKNTFVYVSGLPNDISQDELSEFFKRCGVIRLDPSTG